MCHADGVFRTLLHYVAKNAAMRVINITKRTNHPETPDSWGMDKNESY